MNSNYLSLDLEFNQDPAPVRIIQVGAVVGNVKSGEILEKYSTYIKVPEEVTPYIQQLCNITNEDVQNGISIAEAYLELEKLHTKYDCFTNLITWGGGDSEALRKELPIEMQNQWKFGRRWLDVKTIYQHWRNSKGLSVQAGLAKAMTKMGLTFQGTKHQAPDDALNTFRVYHHLMKEWK